MPSLLKGASGKVGMSNQYSSGVTPYLKKKENKEDKARIMELAVSQILLKLCLEANGRK
jgi:hypothetical protein